MPTGNALQRFTDAQGRNYNDALAEIKNGRKQTHWMWYVFPQIQGLGRSETAKFYAIKDVQEVEAFLKHLVLGSRLLVISRALLVLPGNDPYRILGSPDDIFQIISRMEGRQLFAEPGQAAEFAIGLKLFSEVMLKNRELPLFAELRPAFSEFKKRLKSGPQPPDDQPAAYPIFAQLFNIPAL